MTKRNGYVLSKTLTNVTSAYSTPDQTGYAVANGILYRILPDLTVRALAESMATEFTTFGNATFTHDGLRIEHDSVTDLKISAPEHPLKLTVIDGTLPAGVYSATYCYRSVTGMEGGSAPIATLELMTAGSIAIAPVTPPAGYTAVIYVTDANGTVYYDNDGIALNPLQILAKSFPEDCEKIAYHQGKLWLSKALANGSSIIWFSKPFHYHLYDPQEYMIISGRVLDMASTEQGLVIGTDAAIYAYSENALQKLADYGVVKGRPFTKLPDGSLLMFTLRGVCAALPFKNLSEKKVQFAPGVQCSTAIVQQNGLDKFVALSDGTGVAFNSRY